VDVDLMNHGVAQLVGEHDFGAFCRKTDNRSAVRRVDTAVWRDRGRGLVSFDVSASSFCHQMVRSMVALSVEIGRGRVKPGDVTSILDSKDRNRAKGAAPAHGLTLVRVDY
jgi:tRNA pseudouridine38-40 synthase